MPGSKIKHFFKNHGSYGHVECEIKLNIYKKGNKKIPAVTYTLLDPVW